jgi:Protein of unknown function (DUF2971)
MSVLNGKVADGPGVGKLFAKNFAVLDREGAIPRVAHLFMCSFSSRGDDLGQWRAYADNGRGYALGFDSKALENGFTKKGETPIPNNSTFHVKYNDTQLLEIYGRIVEKMINLILLPGGRGLESATINAYMIELQMRLTLHTLRTALFFKHEAYENEKEYRFMQIHRADEPPPEVKVRSRPYSLVRYREFDWRSVAAGALKQIVVGPGADSQKATQFAQDCLRYFHPGEVEILSSQIPYRAF